MLDIVSVLKMSDLYDVSLDYLLKGDRHMKSYMDYLDESTNIVKSKAKYSKTVLIMSYLVIWAVGIILTFKQFSQSPLHYHFPIPFIALIYG